MRRCDPGVAQGERPRISIVVPCYNVEKYLRACVSSLGLDKHPEIEAVLVDDGSTDGTPAICDELAATNVRLTTIHRENGGSSSARNAGLSHTDGDWVWFVDSDDLVSPYAIEYLLKLSDDSDADVIQFGLQMFDDGQDPAWQMPDRASASVCISSQEWLRRAYSGDRQHYACSFLFHNKEQRNKKDQSCIFFCEEFSLFEDVASVERFMQGPKTVLLTDARLYGYRQVGSSVTHRRSNVASDSGLRAVLEVAALPDVGESHEGKLGFETDMLFVVYGLTERGGDRAKALRADISREIARRVREVGLFGMGAARTLRYVLMRTGALKCYYDFKYRGENA